MWYDGNANHDLPIEINDQRRALNVSAAPNTTDCRHFLKVFALIWPIGRCCFPYPIDTYYHWSRRVLSAGISSPKVFWVLFYLPIKHDFLFFRILSIKKYSHIYSWLYTSFYPIDYFDLSYLLQHRQVWWVFPQVHPITGSIPQLGLPTTAFR